MFFFFVWQSSTLYERYFKIWKRFTLIKATRTIMSQFKLFKCYDNMIRRKSSIFQIPYGPNNHFHHHTYIYFVACFLYCISNNNKKEKNVTFKRIMLLQMTYSCILRAVLNTIFCNTNHVLTSIHTLFIATFLCVLLRWPEFAAPPETDRPDQT